jgi:hypothetical protein
MPELICVRTYTTRQEAEFARDILETNGIKAIVLVDDCGGMLPHLQHFLGRDC